MINSKFIYISCLIVFLVACGGGGGSSDSTVVETPETPVVDEDDDGNSDDSDDDSGATEPDDPSEAESQPNILLIISDDQGLDASAQYDFADDLPITPTIDALAESGITFDNAWATPACTTTRATILTGKYGVNSGVTFVPDVLSTDHQIIQQYLKQNAATSDYASAVFGKWHVGGANTNTTHPNSVGVDHYAGNIGNLDDYYEWELTTDGETEVVTDYHSSMITDLASEWVNEQQGPWFAWVAYSAPHSPYHLPPADLHSRTLSGEESDITDNKRDYYLAAIEAMDTEIGRFLDSMDESVRDNTIVIYIGDNGTPANVIDTRVYARDHSKATLYQGGVSVPLVVSGVGVNRIGQREAALVTSTDLFATIAEIAGIDDSNIHDSYSFAGLLNDETSSSQDFVYTEFESDNVTGWTVRSDEYKLIEYADGSQMLFDVAESFSETSNLLPTSSEAITAALTDLETVARNIVGDDSEAGPIDITNAILSNGSGNCADYVERFTSNVLDVNNGVAFVGDLVISVIGNKCVFNTNAIPNHDFNDGGDAFPNDVSEQSDQFEVTVAPTAAASATELSLQTDNAILLNGVKVDLLAAGCFGVGNGKIGCNDMSQPWRYDPMHAANGFRVDSHNAHSQPDGTYHYHGSPFAMFDDSDDSPSPVVGFAADGFPIFGSYFDDGVTIRKALPSYQLKSGARPSGADDPGGNYDGAFRDDYEFVSGAGDLDACNGMTVDGVYGYYITDDYPYVLGCFTGTPDASFEK